MSESAACRRTREGLTEYLEDALSPRRRQGMERHLEACQSCRGYLAQLQEMIAAAQGAAVESMPAAMKARLVRKLAEGSRSQTRADQR
jgi:anti-sigma factor RsiW